MRDQIGRERRGERLLAGMRQTHREPPRVQELTPKTARVAAPSVHRVANDRETRVREVHADLVRSPGDRPDVEQGDAPVPAPPCRDAAEPRGRLAATGAHDHAPAILGVTLDRRLDDGVRVAGVAPDEREVFLLEALSL